jgi:hypothetical protein
MQLVKKIYKVVCMIIQFNYAEYKHLNFVKDELDEKSISKAYKKCLDKKTLFDMYIRKYSERHAVAYKPVFVAPLKDDVLTVVDKLRIKYHVSAPVFLRRLLSYADYQDSYTELMWGK